MRSCAGRLLHGRLVTVDDVADSYLTIDRVLCLIGWEQLLYSMYFGGHRQVVGGGSKAVSLH